MAQIRVDLDGDTYRRLCEVSLAERRPVDWQAEVIIRKALGLPFPYPEPGKGITPVQPATGAPARNQGKGASL